MSENQREHAKQVVSRFRSVLDEAGVEAVGDGHFDELELMIESAISSAVLDQTESLADRLERMALDVRHNAETFDH